MEKIICQCPNCKVKFKLEREKVGKKVKCSQCAAIFVVVELKTTVAEPNKTQTYSSPDSSKKTQTYAASENASQKTQTSTSAAATRTYQTDSEPLYVSDLTRTYDAPDQRVTKTTHNLSIGDVVTLNGAAYTIVGIISEATGEAVIYRITDLHNNGLALKLYFEFPNPKDEPNPEALQRIKAIRDPDILRLHDFGTGVNKYQHKYCFEICDFAAGGIYSLSVITRRSSSGR